MLFPESPPPRVKVLSGWRAVLFVACIIAAIAILAFVTLGALVIIAPVLIIGAAASLFLPRPKIVLFRQAKPHADGVIEGEYKVVETSKIEPKSEGSFAQSDED